MPGPAMTSARTAKRPEDEQLAPYIRAIGEEKTVQLVLACGGAPLYFAKNPTLRSRVTQIVGEDGVKALERELGDRVRVPLAKKWIATYLASQGLGPQEIARRMHTTDVTVRNYLKGRSAPGQLTLL